MIRGHRGSKDTVVTRGAIMHTKDKDPVHKMIDRLLLSRREAGARVRNGDKM